MAGPKQTGGSTRHTGSYSGSPTSRNGSKIARNPSAPDSCIKFPAPAMNSLGRDGMRMPMYWHPASEHGSFAGSSPDFTRVTGSLIILAAAMLDLCNILTTGLARFLVSFHETTTGEDCEHE
jgi:hypothetical protein